MKLVYTDFFLPILEYFLIVNYKEIFFEWVFPFLIALTAFSFYYNGNYIYDNDFINIVINVLAIIIGFMTASISIFITTDQDKIPLLKKDSDRIIKGVNIKWFRYIFLNMIFSVFSAILTLMLALVNSFLNSLYPHEKTLNLLTFVVIFGLSHTLLLSIRNLTSLYFTYFNLYHNNTT